MRFVRREEHEEAQLPAAAHRALLLHPAVADLGDGLLCARARRGAVEVASASVCAGECGVSTRQREGTRGQAEAAERDVEGGREGGREVEGGM